MMSLVSDACINYIKGIEGFSSKLYDDGTGVMTLGYGLTGSEIRGRTTITEAEASAELVDLVNNKYAQAIKNNLDSRGITLKQCEFDALVSMAYNIGTGGLLGSTLYKNVCAGVRDVNTITANFDAWCHDGNGNVMPGLLRRRNEEASMFFGNASTRVLIYSDSNMMNGPDVTDVQNKLAKLGFYTSTIDGWYGVKSRDAVIAFQEKYGLDDDGKVGNYTRNALDQAIAKLGQPVINPTPVANTYDTSIPTGPDIHSIEGTPFYIEKAKDGRLIIHYDRGNYLAIGQGFIDAHWNDNKGHAGSKRLTQ